MADVAPPANTEPADNGASIEHENQLLDLRLKELDIQSKEYEASHRPSFLRLALTSPAVIAAAIAAWASLTAAGLTWLSGQITATTRREAAQQKAVLEIELERKKFESNLILDSMRMGDADQAARNLEFLISSGLLTGDFTQRVHQYLMNRKPGEGPPFPPAGPP